MRWQFCLLQLVGVALYVLPRILWFTVRQVVGAYILSLVALFSGLPQTADAIAEYIIAELIRRQVPVQNYEITLRRFTRIVGYGVILVCWMFTAFSSVWIMRLMIFGYRVH